MMSYEQLAILATMRRAIVYMMIMSSNQHTSGDESHVECAMH